VQTPVSEQLPSSFAQTGGALLQSISQFFPAGSEAGELWRTLAGAYRTDPSRFLALQTGYFQQQMALWAAMLARERGQPADADFAAIPDAGADKRFAGREWRNSPYYDYMRQVYQLNSRFIKELVDSAELAAPAKEKLRFYTRQLIDAMSPANFAATNPEALQIALETKGESLHTGVRHLIEDAAAAVAVAAQKGLLGE